MELQKTRDGNAIDARLLHYAASSIDWADVWKLEETVEYTFISFSH